MATFTGTIFAGVNIDNVETLPLDYGMVEFVLDQARVITKMLAW